MSKIQHRPPVASSSIVNNTGGDLFDLKPIELAGFKLRARSAQAIGKPTITQWTAALQFANATHASSPYWIGDLLRYSETRGEWAERMDQAISATGLQWQSLKQLTYIARHVEIPEREIAPSISHAHEVASLKRPDQTKWLERARDQEWTTAELRQNIRAAKRTRVIEGQAVLEGKYRVIYADPPWLYRDQSPTLTRGTGAQDTHYGGMTIEALCALPVEAHAMPDAVLFLWTTAPMLLESPGPREVIAAWGFTPKGGIVWDKVLGMPGHYGFQVRHEHLIIATRGHGLPDVPTPHDDSVQTIRRGDEHSGKPAEIRKLIEKHWTRGPYLELFGRERVENWTVFGNDARLWARDKEGATA